MTLSNGFRTLLTRPWAHLQPQASLQMRLDPRSLSQQRQILDPTSHIKLRVQCSKRNKRCSQLDIAGVRCVVSATCLPTSQAYEQSDAPACSLLQTIICLSVPNVICHLTVVLTCRMRWLHLSLSSFVLCLCVSACVTLCLPGC